LWRGAAGGGGAITGTVAAGGDGPAGKQHESLTALVQTCNNFTFTKTMQGQYRLSGRKACDVALFRAGQENKRARETGLVFARTLKGCSAAAGCAAGLLLQKPEPRGQLHTLFKGTV
jgi:hypothetical protein